MVTFNEALALLGLKPNFTEAELKRAYYTQIKTCHPDTHPNDPVAAAKAAKLTGAKDILTKYLKNPEKFREEEANAQASKEYERKAEERRRRSEDVRRQQEEARRTAKANEEKHRRNSLYDKFNSCGFFTALKISRNDFITRDEIYRFYLHIYDIATNIMRTRSSIESEYEYKLKKRTPSGATISQKFKRSFDVNIKVTNYVINLEKKFANLPTALYTVYKGYYEYLDYAYVLDKLEFADLKDFIILDDEQKEAFKDKAQTTLSTSDFVLVAEYLSDAEKDTFQDIHDPINRDYVLDINRVRAYVNEVYGCKNGVIVLKPSADINTANKIFENFIKFYPGDIKRNLFAMEKFIIDVLYRSKRIYEAIGEEKFNIGNDFKKVASISTNFTYLERLYKFVRTCPIAKKCYKALNELNNDQSLKKLGLCAGLEEMYKRFNSLGYIEKFYRPFSFSELAALSMDDFNLVMIQTNRNKEYVEDLVSKDKRYEIYFKLYKFYFKEYERVPIDVALERIKSKCEFIKKLKLDGNLYDLFGLSPNELKAKAKENERNSKIKFIMRYNIAFKVRPTGIQELDKYEKEDIVKTLTGLTEDQLEDIYIDTVLTKSSTLPRFKTTRLTKDIFIRLSDEDKQIVLDDISRQERIDNLVESLNLAYSKLGMKPVKREDFEKLSEMELVNWDLELFNLQREISRMSGGRH